MGDSPGKEAEGVRVGLDVAVAVAVREAVAEGVALGVWLTVSEAVGVALPDDVGDIVAVLDGVAVREAVGVAVRVERQAVFGTLGSFFLFTLSRSLGHVIHRSNSSPEKPATNSPKKPEITFW